MPRGTFIKTFKLTQGQWKTRTCARGCKWRTAMPIHSRSHTPSSHSKVLSMSVESEVPPNCISTAQTSCKSSSALRRDKVCRCPEREFSKRCRHSYVRQQSRSLGRRFQVPLSIFPWFQEILIRRRACCRSPNLFLT